MAKDEKAADQAGGIAEQAMEQARRAGDTYCDFVKQAIAATPSGGNEFAERIKGYAEKNITSSDHRQLIAWCDAALPISTPENEGDNHA
jgi:type II secretory pathway pseudopilin PulG